MGTFRVIALGTGWLLLLSGSTACVVATSLALCWILGVVHGLLVWVVALGGVLSMIAALPVMFFGFGGIGSEPQRSPGPVKAVTVGTMRFPRQLRRRHWVRQQVR